jgi:hypothetical protein
VTADGGYASIITFTTEDTSQSTDARLARDQMQVGIHSENRPFDFT